MRVLPIAEELIELPSGFVFFGGVLLCGAATGNIVGAQLEEFAEVRLILYLHLFRDILAALPMRGWVIEPAVEADFHIGAALGAASVSPDGQ